MSDYRKDEDPALVAARQRSQEIARFIKENRAAPNKGVGGHVRDLGLTALSGAVSVPELAVGLADIPTGGRVGKFLENENGAFGFRPGEAKAAIAGAKTQRSQEQLQEFTDTEGLGGKVGYALKNPSLITNTVVESLPSMFAGGVIGRGLGAAAKGLSPVAAGALGEGAVGAGLAAEQIRQQTDDGLLTGKQAGLAAATGATTAGFGYAGGRLARKLGIGDIDTIVAGGGRTATPGSEIVGSNAISKGIARRAAEGALTEGLLEELPQSVSETILQNEALGRPLNEGVTDAAALGLLSGATMGAGAGMFARNRRPEDRITPTEDMGQEGADYGPSNPNNPLSGRGLPNPTSLLENQAAPQLGFQGRASNQFNAGPDGEVFTGDQYNEYLAGQQERARNARDAGQSQPRNFEDVTQSPQGYDQFGNDPRLPAPDGTDFTASQDGQVYGRDDINARLSQERDAAAERRARIARGEILDRTPVPEAPKPSELMGLDPNKGSLSAAAALAVDSGASDVGNQLRDAVAQEPQMSVWQSGMMDRLSNADQNNSTYARLAQSMQNEPASVSEKARLMREADTLPRAEVAAKQIKPNTRVLDEVRAQTKAYTPEGKEVQAQWDVVDASDLVTSNTDSFTINPDFPASRQPRDRTRASAQQQVNEIASKLQPNLLGESPDVSTGAPFVGANDNVVDSGNGRSMAIRRVYQEGGEKAGEYRQFVNEQAAKFGLDTDAVNMMQSPVLVRRNTSDMNRDEFARAANKPTAARMSSTEQAASDAKNLPDASLLSFNSEGSMSLHQSQRYLKNFIAALPKTEQGSLMDESGALSREGKSRIEAAIVQDAYNNPRLVSAISEKLDNDTTNVLRAVTDKAPQISQINADIKTGDVYDNTLARDIADATQAYIDLKNTDKNINDYLSQDSLLGDGLTDGAKEILSVLSDNRRSAKAIGEYIQERINQVTGRGNPKQGGLSFDDDFEADAPNVLSNEPVPTNTQAATQLTDENPTVNIPAPTPEVSNEESKTKYRLPTEEESYWRLSQPSTERESVLVDAVSQALDEGVIYNKDLNKRVAEILNVPQSVLDVNTRNTENGDFGYDVYSARKKVEANNRDNSNNEARERLKSRLSVGRNIGAIVIDNGKTLRRATIESMDDKSVKIAGTTGSKRLMYGVNYSTLEDAIKRAEDEGKREKFAPPKVATVDSESEATPESKLAENKKPNLRQLDATGRAKDGKGINAGEQFQTATGRETTPYPKQKSEKYASQWLIDNAVAEAEARGNKFAARQFANTDIQKGGYLLQADQESMQQYLFDDSSTVADIKVTSLKDMADANELKTIAPKASEPKFSRAAGLSETAELKDLLVVHNITSEGVLAATELGGLAAPSIAVIRSEVSDFSGYGEITLVADPLFITGKDMPTYDADIYSPRQPRPIFDINEKKFRDFENSLSGSQYKLRAPTTSDLAEGADRLLRSEAVQYEFLKSIGKEPKLKNAKIEPAIKAAAKIDLGRQAAADNPKFLAVATSYFESQMQETMETMAARAKFKGEDQISDADIEFVKSVYFGEDGSLDRNQLDRFLDKVNRYKQSDGKDYAQLSKDLTEKMRSPLIQRRFEKWATDKFNSLVDGKVLFKGFTPGGSRKYAPYNLENVVKEMTGKLNNGENFSYGAGSVRSVYANELKTLKDIQARREKIIPKEDFLRIKEESNQVFSDALENLRPYYKYDADSWNYTSDAANAIADGSASIKDAFGTNKAAKKIIDDLTYYLSNLPTEYFEAKAQRAVQFNEFDTAIVPKDANPEAVKVLRDAGVKIKRYDQKIEGDKNRIIAQQTKLMFSKPESERANPNAGKKVKGSTQTTRQQVISKLSDKFGKETIAKLMADGKLDIKVLSDFVKNGRLTIPSDVDGLYHNGKATLIADNLSDEMIIPTFLHELGGHGGMQTLMDKKAYDALMKDFDALVAAGDPLAVHAKAIADKVARNKQEALDEYIPYLLTLASRQQVRQGKVAGMINRMVMAVRAFLRDMLGVSIKINSQDILSLAERMVNEVEKQNSAFDTMSAMPQFSDPKNPDIRFSRAAGMNDEFDPRNIAKETATRLYDWASSAPPGKLSWWHKTIGTMYNLAQRNPYFKPVFENTEKFINDVSFYAAKASELAPRLLPQLDSLRDITKSAIGAKDNEALSKPIFEGTLLWGRDLDGKAVLIEDWRKKVMAASKQDRLQMLKDANRITPAQLQQLATLNNIQANRFINGIIDEEVSAGLVWTDSELRSKFDLSDEQIELYREFRSATDKSLDSLTRSDMLRRLGKDANDIETAVMEAGTLREAVFNIEQHINSLIQASPKKEKALKQTLKDIKESQFRTNKLIDDGYAPLSRFGQYTVDVVDADGNREYFGMFESAYEARKMEAEMKALYDDPATHTVSRGTLSNEEFKLFAGVTPETAELFGEMLGLDATGDKAADEAFQEYLKRTKNNRSAMKRLMHRKGIKGYSEDVGRVLASFIYSNARHTSAALNMSNIDRSIQDIPKGEGQLKDAAVKLAEYIKNPQEEAQLMRGWMFAQYLGGSIASAVVNITQPIAVSFPYLSQFGGAVKAASQLGKASSDWTKAFKDKDRSHFEPDLLEAIERAEADGTLSPQEVHNLLKQAAGKNPLSAGDGTKIGDARALAGNALSRVSLAWGSLFSGAEQINRRVTFVAAYRLAKEQGMDNPADFATKSIKETQFVYNKASRMNWGRGAVGGTLMTFKTYTVSYIELMHRLWNQGEKGSVERAQGRKATMIMLGVMFMLSGSGGLPFMEDAEDLIDGIGQIMGYNLSSKKARQDFLDAWFGEMLGDFLESGASTLPGSPTDVSGRLGLGNLIPGTGIFKERTNNTRDVLEIAGPAGDFAGRIATGTRDIAKGVANLDATSLKKGALEFSPTAVRNAVKGIDMGTSGIYKDTKGYKVTDVSPVDAAFKFAGFQPLKVSKIQEANYLGQTATSFYSLRASNIRALWAAGVVEGNSNKVADAKAAVKDWNAKNPDQKIVIRPTDIARRVREMKMDKSERVTKLAPKSMRAQMASDFSQVRDGF